MFANKRTTATASTKAYYAGIGTQKTVAGTKDTTTAQPRRFGTNLSNRYPYNVDAAKKPVATKAETGRIEVSRPRTAGALTKDISRDVAKPDPIKRTLGSVKVVDVSIPDAGVDSAHDRKDPTKVCAYVNDIIAHLRREEVKYMPDPNYFATMQSASGLAARHRISLFDWVIEVHRKFKTLRQETLWLAFNIIDRFLSKREVAKAKLQLVGATAILIASKMEDMWPPLVRDLVYVASKAFTKDDVTKMERTICNAIHFEIVVPTLAPFIARFSKAAQFDSAGKQLVQYIAELSIHDYGMIKYTPSMIAASAVSLAIRMLQRGRWTSTLEGASGYSEAKLEACMRQMNGVVSAPPAEMKAVQNKYSRVSKPKAVAF